MKGRERDRKFKCLQTSTVTKREHLDRHFIPLSYLGYREAMRQRGIGDAKRYLRDVMIVLRERERGK